jgi:alpha-D-ribose 1-methylphosphonate 5-triphosphate diphosphatase
VPRAGALRSRFATGIHLRAEICSETLGEELERVRTQATGSAFVSLMDHTPGQRQFRELAALRRFALERDGMSDDTFTAHVADLKALGGPGRPGAPRPCHRLPPGGYGAILASHDDTTADHVAASRRPPRAPGSRNSRRPTLPPPNRRARGIAVMMGAPNILRGGSHSGNVAAEALARGGILDILSSDYAPAALLQGALRLARDARRRRPRASLP